MTEVECALQKQSAARELAPVVWHVRSLQESQEEGYLDLSQKSEREKGCTKRDNSNNK